jgi:hypothetical protein
MIAESAAWQRRYRRACYEGKPGWKDGTEEFHEMCSSTV